ncbi:MAG: cobalamin-dependent protein [Deltaproteobacteria bacterium]|nr:cobalamin-dependent protein [Deltaproteobacteria bacterium]
MAGRTIRVVIAKPGLDGHDRGAKVLCLALRDRGLEVIYTGLHRTPEQIAETVLEESADVLGLSIMSGAHLVLTEKVLAELSKKKLDDVHVLVGGVIPGADAARLEELGVAGVFPTGADFDAVADRIKELAGG